MPRAGDMAHKRFALWAIPHEGQLSWLLETIHRLARRGGGRPFYPHLTLASGELPVNSSPEHLVARLAGNDCFGLDIRGLELGDSFFQAIVLALDEMPCTDQIEAAILPLVPRVNVRKENLHLSLFYGDQPEAELRRLCGGVNIPYQRLQFTRIQLVSPRTEWRDIDNWAVLAESALKENV